MLTPGGVSILPCLTRAMFDGRISFDGIATVKNFVVGSYDPFGLQVKKKSKANFRAVTLS
jgi:hypothetical protein